MTTYTPSYSSENSDTAQININNQENTIQVNVLKVPNKLKVIDTLKNSISFYDGSVEQFITLYSYSIEEVTPSDNNILKEYCLYQNGNKTDYVIQIPKQEQINIDNHTLKFNSNNQLYVNTATSSEQDSTLPITAGAVYTEIGNINTLLSTI